MRLRNGNGGRQRALSSSITVPARTWGDMPRSSASWQRMLPVSCLILFTAAAAVAAFPQPSMSGSTQDGVGVLRALLQTAVQSTPVGSGANTSVAGNVSAASLGAWASGSNFSVPVTAKAFRFGTSGETVTLTNNYCGYGPLSTPYVVGISPSSPLATRRPLQGCGTCLEVVCAPGSSACVYPESTALTPASSIQPPADALGVVGPGHLLMRVVDICDSCGPLDLNLHADAFAQLADPRVGITNITYRYVACPSGGQNISIYVSGFRATQGGWIRLSALNVAGNGLVDAAIAHCPRPATSASGANASAGGGSGDTGGLVPGCEGTLRGPSWRVMRNTVGAQWEFSGLPALPLDLRLTDVDGREIIAWSAITNTSAPALYTTQAQFPPLTPTAQLPEGIGSQP